MGSRRRMEDATTGTRQGVSGGRRVWRRTQGRESGSRRRAEVRRRARDGAAAATGRGAATERFVCCGLAGEGRCERKGSPLDFGLSKLEIQVHPTLLARRSFCGPGPAKPRSTYIQFIQVQDPWILDIHFQIYSSLS
jgi:hypothetical protein